MPWDKQIILVQKFSKYQLSRKLHNLTYDTSPLSSHQSPDATHTSKLSGMEDNPTVQLRPPKSSDLGLLWRWNNAPHISAAKGTGDWGWQTELKNYPYWREQLIAEVECFPIVFLQIIDTARDESHYWRECQDDLRAIDIWIGEVTYIGCSFSREMMRLAL